jgi:hypothetical protein
VSATDDRIDELYQLPLAEFTPARNALAKTLKGDEAAQVKRLEKPTVVAWAVNQLYWRERRTWDRLIAAGHALRSAQIAALKGKSGDIRGATADHRAALAAALATAAQLAAQAGSKPASEPLSRMLEALSLAAHPPAAPGRFADIIQPAGFEALAGVTPVVRAGTRDRQRTATQDRTEVDAHQGDSAETQEERRTGRANAEALRRAQAARRKAAEAEVQHAKRSLEHANAAEARAEANVEAARQTLAHAEAAHAKARQATKRATEELASKESALKTL